MGSLGFRDKLLLAMMLVVGGVTGATLFVTQQGVQATYERLFQDQFKSQFDFFSQKQQARLKPIKEILAQAEMNPRLIAAMENAVQLSREDRDIIDLYKNGTDQLSDLWRAYQESNSGAMAPGNERTPALAGARPSPDAINSRQPFFLFYDNQGHLLMPREPEALPRPVPGVQNISNHLAAISQSVCGLGAQQVGYLALEEAAGGLQLKEVIFTPIIDRVGKQTHGVLVLGFPVAEATEPEQEAGDAPHAGGGVRSGIWLDGVIYSQLIPKEAQAPLAARLAAEVKVPRRSREGFIVPVARAPHRVFFETLNPQAPFPPAYQICLYSLAPAEQEKRGLRWKIVGAGGGALLVALGSSWLLARSLSVPINDLVKGTVAIEQGNFAVHVPVRARDELGKLAASFNEMAVGLALKEKYRSVLNMVADKKVAEALMSGKVELGGELRSLSVLFCDIRGFTALTQNMPPGEVIAMLNEHMTLLTRIVYEHGGVVDKFVGDLIMALFGAPRSTGDDAGNAARCALRMIEERQKLNATARHKVAVGIGLATGQAVAGCMGSHDRLNYTVLGERVNLASRLCGQAGSMEVVIDQATQQQLAGLITVQSLPPLRLKGFSDLMPAFKLLAIHPLQTTL
jgi:class 3 adenylate cyclase